jgi:hypothetical protein
LRFELRQLSPPQPTNQTNKNETQKNKGRRAAPFQIVAEWTGLEPATPGVTGRYSNQLNYHSAYFLSKSGSSKSDSGGVSRIFLVGAEGFEPPTLAL